MLFSNAPYHDIKRSSSPANSSTWLYLCSMLLGQAALGLAPIANISDMMVLDFNKMGPEKFLQATQKFRPDFVGTTCYETNWEEVRDFGRLIKGGIPNVIFGIGGPGPTNIPRAMLKLTEADIAVRGEADFTFRKAVAILKSGARLNDLLSIDGVLIRQGDKILEGTRSNIIPIVPQKEFEKIKINFKLAEKIHCQNGYTAMDFTFSRACPKKRCSFCQISPIFKYRQLEVGQIISILKRMLELPELHLFSFGDAIFGGTRKRAHQILNRMIQEMARGKMRNDILYACETSVDNLLMPGKFGEREPDYELLYKMYLVKMVDVFLGVEHLSIEGLRSFNKLRYTPEEAEKVIRAMAEFLGRFGNAQVGLIHRGVDTPPEAIIEHLQYWFRLIAELPEIKWQANGATTPFTGTAEYQKIIEALRKDPNFAVSMKQYGGIDERWHEFPEEKEYPYLFGMFIPTDITTAKVMMEIYLAADEGNGHNALYIAMLLLQAMREEGDEKLRSMIDAMQIPFELQSYMLEAERDFAESRKLYQET